MEAREIIGKLLRNIDEVIVGKEKSVRLCLAALLSKGHVLIEDVPGLGKTTLAKTMAASLNATFHRIQFTPDLLPSDITGVSVYNQKNQEFEPRLGAIFAHIILADEINRSTPRTQSGLLECMQENRVTIDGQPYDLPQPFFVIATQNPVESHGTYPLPEAQLDRFLLQVSMGYPSRSEEISILDRQGSGISFESVRSVVGTEDIIFLQQKVREVYISEDLKGYIADIVGKTRTHPDILLGASPRGSLALSLASRAIALIAERDFVIPDDIIGLINHALVHRIILKPEAQIAGKSKEVILRDILQGTRIPL